MPWRTSFRGPSVAIAVLSAGFLAVLATFGDRAAAADPAPFVVVDSAAEFRLPMIVVQRDPARGTGVDWEVASKLYKSDDSEAGRLRDAVVFLHEGVRRTTGRSLAIKSRADVSEGIVLTTLAGSPELAADPEIAAALRNDGTDDYNDREAFFLRSEPERMLIVANTVEGLIAAVPELLESVGYEVLGMGPNWVHVPGEDAPQGEGAPPTPLDGPRSLAFRIRRAGRAGYYQRLLAATSGQSYGVGTIFDTPLSDPADETVDVSYKRWRIGMRMHGSSMPGFPGHALQAYHKAVVERIVRTGSTAGFLAATSLGPVADRPPATADNAGSLWIAPGEPPLVFLSNGREWSPAALVELGVNLDLSLPFVRELILEDLKRASEAAFKAAPDRAFIFGTDPEDGAGYAALEKWLTNRNWYPEYLAARGVEFGRPYVLHGHKGLDQPRELWDPSSPSDTVFAFNNWLLREYDAWIEGLPAERRATAAGRPKKELLRCSFLSYNYHDLPPNFNVDPRVRVMIASYPKHRGRGKWKAFASQEDLARAFQIMLPREPSGDYRIISLSYFQDPGLDNIPALWSAASQSIHRDLVGTYRAGIKALACETDFNFGRYGLAYYLYAKTLWNPAMSAEELDALRDRWLRRAYGSAWREMKAYYDFMLVDRYPVNGPSSWAHAIRTIDAADRRLDPAREPAAKRRIDDLKQFWYFHYLSDKGNIPFGAGPTWMMKSTDPVAKEFLWKGQMSYMVAQHVVSRRTFGVEGEAALAVGSELASGPAHYTAAETAAWWAKILEHWPETPVDRFADATLADGRRGSAVDMNDLVGVREFAGTKTLQPFYSNSGFMRSPTILQVATRAGDPLGFQLAWPRDPTGKDGYYIARNVAYGVERWDAEAKAWDALVDPSLTTQPSREIDDVFDGSKRHLAEVRYVARRPGTYRLTVGNGGNLSYLADLGFDWKTGQPASDAPKTGFASGSNVQALTQEPTYVYIPRGTKSLDLEGWDGSGRKLVALYKGWRGESPPPPPRTVDIGARRTHRIALAPGEDGSLARIEGDGFAFPYLYSIPPYWSKSPHLLLVPRAVAKADGLTPAE